MQNQKLIKIATRNSPLAMWQAEFVADKLKKNIEGLEVQIIGMTTKGDQMLDSPLAKIGGKGLFVKELEASMLNNETDIAVHSMKDVGVSLPDGLAIKAILKRDNPFDAFVSNKYQNLAEMPDSSVVGTCSLRRVCQLKNIYPNLVFKDLRGNVNTRLKKLDDGEYDAIILAAAGLERLGMNERITSVISSEICLPAITQGSMGIECRKEDLEIIEILQTIADDENTIRATAERAVNERLNGSCQTPIAAYCTIDGENIHLRAIIGEPDGSIMLNAEVTGLAIDARGLGLQAADYLIEQGALDILAKI